MEGFSNPLETGGIRIVGSALVDAADYYSGLVADAYAKLKSVSFAAELYAQFVRTSGQPGLEIGCGDGEPLLELCAAGLDVDGVDSSLDMVQRCRTNAAARGLQVEVFHQRVEHLSLDRRYGSIYFAGPTFNLLPDDETARQALRAIARQLTDTGTAMIPLWIPGPTPEDELGVARQHEDDDGTALRFIPVEETYDRRQRTRVTTTRYQRVTADGVETVDREWVLHWHTVAGFRRLCAEAEVNLVGLVDDATGSDADDDSTSFTATVQA